MAETSVFFSRNEKIRLTNLSVMLNSRSSLLPQPRASSPDSCVQAERHVVVATERSSQGSCVSGERKVLRCRVDPSNWLDQGWRPQDTPQRLVQAQCAEPFSFFRAFGLSGISRVLLKTAWGVGGVCGFPRFLSLSGALLDS
jgi:hypothetical protein